MHSSDDGISDRDRDAPAGLDISLESDSQGVQIRLIGELDVSSAPKVDRVLRELETTQERRLLIDLARVAFIDSIGLAAIVRAVRAADHNGHRLTLRRGSPQVQRLFELTGMLDRLTFED